MPVCYKINNGTNKPPQNNNNKNKTSQKSICIRNSSSHSELWTGVTQYTSMLLLPVWETSTHCHLVPKAVILKFITFNYSTSFVSSCGNYVDMLKLPLTHCKWPNKKITFKNHKLYLNDIGVFLIQHFCTLSTQSTLCNMHHSPIHTNTFFLHRCFLHNIYILIDALDQDSFLIYWFCVY